MDASEIDSPEKLKEWLETLPETVGEERARQIAVTIAFRAAARVFPVAAWGAPLENGDTTASRKAALIVFQHCCKTMFAASSLDAVRSSLSHGHHTDIPRPFGFKWSTIPSPRMLTAVAAFVSARAAFHATKSPVFLAACAEAVAKAGEAASSNETLIFECCQTDALALQNGLSTDGQPLWTNHNRLSESWGDVRAKLAEDVDNWSPVIAWYEHLLDPKGRALPLEMLHEIAMREDIDWESGPPKALPVIGEIWGRYMIDDLIRSNPLGLRVQRDATSGRLYSTPIEYRDMSQIIEDVRRGLTEYGRRCRSGTGNFGPSMWQACEPVIKEARKKLGRLADNPRELLRLLEETRRALNKIAGNEGFASDERLDRLIGNLEQREEDICVAAPEVLEEKKARLKVRVQLWSVEQVRAATRVSTGMFLDSEGMLAAAMARSVILVNSEDASEEEKQAAWTFLAGAVSRGLKVMRDAGAEGSDPRREGAVEALVRHADTAAKLDKGVDAIQEAAAEGGPWVTELFTQVTSGNFFRWGA